MWGTGNHTQIPCDSRKPSQLLSPSCPDPAPPYFLRQGISPNLELVVQVNLAGQRASRSLLSYLQRCGLRCMHASLCTALWMLPCATLKGRPGKAHSDSVSTLRAEAAVRKKTVSEKCWPKGRMTTMHKPNGMKEYTNEHLAHPCAGGNQGSSEACL